MHSFNIFHKENGDIYVCGSNNNGQLGLGHNNSDNYNYASKPIFLMNNKDVRQISIGTDHTIIHDNNGDVYVFGKNNEFQLGLKDNNTFVNKPTFLMNNKDIQDIICGTNYTIFHTKNDEIIGFGSNFLKSSEIGLSIIAHIKTPQLLMTNKNIKQMKGGIFHNVFLTNNNEAYLCGNKLNKFNEYIDAPKLLDKQDIKNIYCGTYYTLIHKCNGDLINLNNNKILMNDKYIKNIVFFDNHIIVQNHCNEIWHFNNNISKILFKDNNILAISSNFYELLIYYIDGQLLKMKACKFHVINQINYIYYCEEIINDKTIISINGHKVYMEWTPENHQCIEKTRKQCILGCMFANKYVKHKIPKLLLFEIFKLL
jgi:alpha-tubulin suppressor-like RCC1 family protein